MRTTPRLECDLILKGGITSGVVYPLGVCELARTFRLRSVGGSSSGAIAAAAAAAAELGRAEGGFERLAELPGELVAPVGGGTRLLSLFRPQPATRPLFRVVRAALRRGPEGGALAVLGAALAAYAWAAIAGAGFGLTVAVVGAWLGGPAAWVAVGAGVVLAVVGALAGVALAAWRTAWVELPRNGFGLCSGGPDGSGEALTPWLHGLLQGCAGRPLDRPVTFGDLAASGIDLRVMTTNLTQRRPMAMPWPEAGYYFDPAEWRGLFPDAVVDWLLAHPPASAAEPAEAFDAAARRLACRPLAPLPDPAELPIVLATRMSVSFPLLISAVRLYGIDHARPENREFELRLSRWRRDHPEGTPEEAVAAVGRPRLEPNWFVDGGATSNLPLHFFDAPLPTRPTFAMNLVGFRDDADRSDDEARNSYLPTSNSAGVLRRWHPFDATTPRALTVFGRALLETVIGWVDDSQLVMPGYRDRIVRVYNAAGEGGFNLTMEPGGILRLAERGRLAAAKLVDQFAGPEGHAPGWENHRWVRMRTSVAALSEWLDGFEEKYRAEVPGTTPYSRLAGPGAEAPLPSYPLAADDRAEVNAWVGEVLELGAASDAPALRRDAPRPLPTMRVVAYDRPAGVAADGSAEPPVGVPTPTRPASG